MRAVPEPYQRAFEVGLRFDRPDLPRPDGRAGKLVDWVRSAVRALDDIPDDDQ